MAWDWEKLKEQDKQRRRQTPVSGEEIFKRFSGGNFTGLWLVILGIAVLFVIWSTVYTVQQNEQAVVQRFGAYNRTDGPGLHFKWPYPVEKQTKVNVLEVEHVYFEGRPETEAAMRVDEDAGTNDESLMLTGDLNVAVVPWIVQYRVDDPKAYLFNVADPVSTLKDLSESSMRLIVGDRSIDEVLSRREEIEEQALKRLQDELKEAGCGIFVKKVALKTVNVPPPVQPSFNEVNQAKQEKQQLIYQAKEDYNKAIPDAEGEAERVVKAAEGYEIDRVNRAKGETARFESVFDEYAKAPEITRKRLYLEAMGETLPKTGRKFLVDPDNGQVLPLLNLERYAGEKP